MESFIVIHYAGEIGVKGGKRQEFENRLIRNIQAAFAGRNIRAKVRKLESRLVAELHPEDEPTAIDALKSVFGIEWFSPVRRVPARMEEIEKGTDEATSQLPRTTIRVETRRSDKAFPLNSQQVNQRIGKRLKDAGFGIDLEKAEHRLYIEILHSDALISMRRIPGLGGLPYGTAGKLLALFSGGIDSPLAAWLMMRRGCEMEFLHVHPYPNAGHVRDSKIVRLVRVLRGYGPSPLKLHLASYMEFYKKTTELPAQYELILFRRFIFRLADGLAKEREALGLVSGDSVGQVASQTLQNLQRVEMVSALPIYRPLVAYDKQEIIDRCRKIGTYETSIEDYRDCCSLVASKHPATSAREDFIARLEKEIDIGGIVERTQKTIETVEV